MQLLRPLWALSVLASLVGTGHAHASSLWTEVHAGDLPLDAESTAGSGVLSAIEGTIETPFDRDIFLIFIAQPSEFSASTNNAGTQLSEDNDTQLFLFDLGGMGLVGNDDDPDGFDYTSALPAGSFAGDPGLYYLAISLFDDDPVSLLGEIFDEEPSADGVQRAVLEGAAMPIVGWTSDPNPLQTGAYRIELTGALFAETVPAETVPEPAPLGLIGAGMVSLAWLCLRRRDCGARRCPMPSMAVSREPTSWLSR